MADTSSDPNDPRSVDPRSAPVPPGFASEEVFQNIVNFESLFKRLLPTLIMLFLITWLIFALVFGAIGVPLAGLVGAFASGGFCAAMTQLKKKQHAKQWVHKTLTLSPFGADMQDGGLRLQLPWGQVERIGEASSMDPVQAGGFHWLGVAAGALSASTMRRREMFLLGVGRISVDPEASVLVKSQVKQNLAGQDPERCQTGVPLAHFEKDWENGRIGQWVRAYRPDLVP